MQRSYTDSPWYSIIAAIMLIGFLLVLTTSTLNLVLQEMQDGRGRQNYLKAYAAAEWSMELWLLQIKNKGYGFWTDAQNLDILGTDKKDPKIGYTYDGKVQSYSWSLDIGKTDIFPLFWIDDTGTMNNISSLTLAWGTNLVWNILGDNRGISGIGNFQGSTSVDEKKTQTIAGNTSFVSQPTTIQNFLSATWPMYLIVYNPSTSTQSYTLTSAWSDFFTTPRETLQSTARVGKYSQNIDTTIDNTEFLGILQYSIYSGN